MDVMSKAVNTARDVAPSGPSIDDEDIEDFALEHDPTGTAAGLHRRIQNAQSQVIISGIVIAAALLIGIFVVSQINTAIPSISNAQLSSARDDTVGITGDAMQLGAVVVLVIFASVILRVLQGL